LLDLDGLSGLATRAAEAIERHRTGRVPIAVVRDAVQAADLSLVGSPDARHRIAALVAELELAGVIATPKTPGGWDRSFLPPLPRWVLRPTKARSPRPQAGLVTWHAALGWAATGRWSGAEQGFLEAVNAWLIAGGPARKVPLQERSLELLGDEKAIHGFLRGRLFAEGRLSLDLLGAERSSAPFVFTKLGSGPYALVVENSATYRTIVNELPPDSPVGIVVFGAGNGFLRSVEYFAELADTDRLDGPIRHIRYFGDLDADGLRIPIGASEVAAELGLPPVRPAAGLYCCLLEFGRPAPDSAVDVDAAAALARWLPSELSERATSILVAGERLAQEAVGRDRLTGNSSWATIEQLGAVTIDRPLIVRAPDLPTGVAAATTTDAGDVRSPATDVEWDGWVSAGRTRNSALGDTLLDWLGRHGRAHGFVPDTDRPGYDERTDFAAFVQRKGQAFEAGVLGLLAERETIVRIGEGWQDARSEERTRATVEAMTAAAPIIASGVLRNPDTQTYGMPDLLVRSDVLARLFPGSLDYDEAHQGAPGLRLEHVHYRVVDIKFHTFGLLGDGSANGDTDSLPYLIQVWLYNEALGRIAQAIPPAAYLLGRNWTAGDVRGTGCLERLARVDRDRYFSRRETTLSDLAAEAVHWVRRVRAHGAHWSVLPKPTVPELYPHMRNTEDAPWHAAKAEIAAELRELTLLPRMNPARRNAALAAGIDRWDHPAVTAIVLGIDDPPGRQAADAVLAANRSDVPILLPERLVNAGEAWRTPAAVEFYVDFETTNSLADDFAKLPAVGGQPLIFQIGCGHWQDGEWQFAQWTAERLDPASEGWIIGAWLDHMSAAVAATGVGLADARIIHWSPAEPVSLETAYNAARTRHPDADWPLALPWFDFLVRVIRAAPVAVTGAFNFGLKSIVKAMHAAGMIETRWVDGPTDGLGAMVGAWWCDQEAARTGVPMIELDLMRDIAAYNAVDVRAMADVVRYVRENR
jgi:hypothetical protein